MTERLELIKECLNIEHSKALDIKYDITKNKTSYLINGNKVIISYKICEKALTNHNLGNVIINFFDKNVKQFKVNVSYYSPYNTNDKNKEYSGLQVDYDPLTTNEVDFIRALNIGLIKASCIRIFVDHFKKILSYKLDKYVLGFIDNMDTGDIFEYLYFLNKERIHNASDFEVYWNLQNLKEDESKESILKNNDNFINHIKQYNKRELYGNIKH